MTVPTLLVLSKSSRPPALKPRRRSLAAHVEQTLRSWIEHELRGSTAELRDISEWISLDPRAIPHTVIVRVKAGRSSQRCVVIEKATERIVAADVIQAIASLGLPRCVHCAPFVRGRGPAASQEAEDSSREQSKACGRRAATDRAAAAAVVRH